MSFIVCMSVLGVLLMLLALTSSYLRWMPVTTSAVCLGFGFGIGPMGLDIVNLDFEKSYEWLERLTEVAVLFSCSVRASSCACRCAARPGTLPTGWPGQ